MVSMSKPEKVEMPKKVELPETVVMPENTDMSENAGIPESIRPQKYRSCRESQLLLEEILRRA